MRSVVFRFVLTLLFLASTALADHKPFCPKTFHALAVDAPDSVTRALQLAQLPESERRLAIARLTREEALALADIALAAGFGLVPVDASRLPTEALQRVHPTLAMQPGRPISPALLAQFQNSAARSLLTAYRNRDGHFVRGVWSELAEHAATGASPDERRAMARSLFGRLRRLPMQWGEQTRYDQFVDSALGLHADAVTQRLQGLSEADRKERFGDELVWSEFGNRNLLTPYFEFQNVVDKLNPQPGQTFVDLGSGLGRQGIFLGITRPGVKFRGYEIVDERVNESQRAANNLALGNVHFERQDLSSPTFKPEPADYYYAFNPVSGATFLKMMNDLREQSVKSGKPFTLVLAFSKDTGKIIEYGTGFTEVTPEARFADDDFARFFHFDPTKPWKPYGTDRIVAQRKVDASISAATATSNGESALVGREPATQKPDPVAITADPLLAGFFTPHLGAPRPSLSVIAPHGSAPVAPRPATLAPEPLGETPRPLRWEDKAIVEKAIAANGSGFSHVDFASLWGWHAADEYRVSRRGDAIVLSGRVQKERVFFEPLGVPPAERVRIMKELARTVKPAPKFVYVSPEVAKLLAPEKGFDTKLDIATQDYVYDTAKLAMLATAKEGATGPEPVLGKDLRYKRNKALEYAASSPAPEFKPMTADLRAKVLTFVEHWATANADRIGPAGVREAQATLQMVAGMEALGLEGRVLLQGGEVVGFSLGRQTNPTTFVVLAEKANMGAHAGAYPYLAGRQAQELVRRGITRVNRMDDGGESHLLKAKQGLEPSERPPVFTATLGGDNAP